MEITLVKLFPETNGINSMSMTANQREGVWHTLQIGPVEVAPEPSAGRDNHMTGFSAYLNFCSNRQ